MSWLFGGKKSNAEQQEQQTQGLDPANDSKLKQTLGFDPSQVTNVSNIISTPGALDTSRLHLSLIHI